MEPQRTSKMKKSQKNSSWSSLWTPLWKGRRKRTHFRVPGTWKTWIPLQRGCNFTLFSRSHFLMLLGFVLDPPGSLEGCLFRQMHAKGPSKKTLKILMWKSTENAPKWYPKRDAKRRENVTWDAFEGPGAPKIAPGCLTTPIFDDLGCLNLQFS